MPRLAPLFLSLALLAGCGSAPPPAAEGEAMAFMAAPRFGDLDPVDWPGRTPAAYAVHGIDVSRYQKSVDWTRVRRSGISFAYVKATEGGDRVDPMFEDHSRGARRAGLRTGAYHFYYFCRPAEDQARWFIENVPRDPRALPPVLDLEWNHTSPTCRLRPDGATVRAEAQRFLAILERHYGVRPIVYTTPDFYEKTGIGRLRGTTFWLRSVADHPSATYPGASWTFWQYTGTGVVPGIAGGVDINVFRGSPDAWIAWNG